MEAEAFAAAVMPLIEEAAGGTLDSEQAARVEAILPHVQERAKLLPEVPDQIRFLLGPIDEYDETSWEKAVATPEGATALDGAINALADIETWDTQTIDDALRGMLAAEELSARKGLQPIRVAISGSTVSPPLFESLEVLGREESLARLNAARTRLD